MSDNDTIYNNEEELKVEKRLDTPRMFKVLLHNDHYTTMDFVIEVLTNVFHMDSAKATQIMLDVHKKGIGICGFYTYDIATTKVNQVRQMAEVKQFPLQCSCEEE